MQSVASSNPTLTAGGVCMLVAPLWCDLGCCSQTVVVQVIIKAAVNPRLFFFNFSYSGNFPTVTF